MILGKFLPPHRGHQFLVDFARHYVEHLTVLVCTLERDPIDGLLRYQWMREMFPDVDVRHVRDDLPQEPCEHPAFWSIWRDVVLREMPGGVDYVFASEDYGFKLAEVLGATYVPVDHARELMPVSGTAVRRDPLRHWEMLPEVVRPYFIKRVCVMGPESSGKSTLAQKLAKAFETVYVWEYARPLLDFKDGRCDLEDIPRIARGHLAAEQAMARHANRVLFSDTDAITTILWAEHFFGQCPDWIRRLADERRYDLYLVLSPNVPWVDDGQRCQPELPSRHAFFDRCVQELEARGRRYVVIRGDWESRFAQGCEAVRSLLRTGDA